MLTFSEALSLLKQGTPMQRRGWNGRDMFIELQVPDDHSKITLPYLYMRTVQGDLVPWLASQTDILSSDWQPYYPLMAMRAMTPNPNTDNAERTPR